MKQSSQTENFGISKGVSTVVGVILMVSLVVVLVAVVGVFIFGLNPWGEAVIATTNVEVTEDGYLIEVDDMGNMNSLSVRCDNTEIDTISQTGQHTITTTSCDQLTIVGDTGEDKEVVTSMDNVGHPEPSGSEPAELAVGGDLEMDSD